MGARYRSMKQTDSLQSSDAERPPDQAELVVDHDGITVDGVCVRVDDRIQGIRERLSLRAKRARSFTRRMYLLFAAMAKARTVRSDGYLSLSLIHISEPTRLLSISYAVFCLK